MMQPRNGDLLVLGRLSECRVSFEYNVLVWYHISNLRGVPAVCQLEESTLTFFPDTCLFTPLLFISTI